MNTDKNTMRATAARFLRAEYGSCISDETIAESIAEMSIHELRAIAAAVKAEPWLAEEQPEPTHDLRGYEL